jgi:hypothetical protein
MIVFLHEINSECASSSGRSGHHDIRILNLDSVTKVAVIRDAVDGPPKPLSNLNFSRVTVANFGSDWAHFLLSCADDRVIYARACSATIPPCVKFLSFSLF